MGFRVPRNVLVVGILAVAGALGLRGLHGSQGLLRDPEIPSDPCAVPLNPKR